MRTLIAATVAFATALPLAGCFDSQKDISSYLVSADRAKAEGNLPRAISELRNAAKLRPQDPHVNLELAKAEDQAGDLRSAVPHYLQAAVPDAHLLEPQLRVVQILIDSGRYVEGSGRINTTLGSFPGNPDALALRADLEERQGQLGPANIDAQESLLKNTNNARALAVLGMLKLRDKDGAGAISVVDRGLQTHPKDMRLLQVRAAAFLTMNQPEKAVEALRKIIQSTPENVPIQTALANVEAENGHLDSAISNFREAVDTNPADDDLKLAFISFLAGQKRIGDLVAFLHKLIDSNPHTSTYDLLLADYLRSNGQLDQAGVVLDQAAARLQTGKDFLIVEVARAKRDAILGRIGSAVARLDAVLTTDPQNTEALLFHATLDQDGGHASAAVENLLKVVRIDPVNGRAFQQLANAYLAMKQPQLAIEAMQRSVAVSPNDVGAQIRLATFLQSADQINSARDLMTRLTLQNPDNPLVWLADGQLAIGRQDLGTARRAVARLRDLPPASAALLTLNAKLAAVQGNANDAMGSFQNAIATDPKLDPGIIGEYARTATLAGQAKAASDFLEAKVSVLPTAVRLQTWAAIMTLNADAKRFERSDAAFQAAVRLEPQNIDLYDGYIRILSAQARWSDASRVIAAGLSAGCPVGPMALLAGSIKEQSGDTAGALASYKQAFDDNPLSVNAANNYASLLADLDPKNTEALQKARSALSGLETSTDPNILDTLGWLDYRLGRIDQAKLVLTRIDAAKQPNPQIRFHLAAVLLATGDKAGGMALLKELKGQTFLGSEEATTLSEG